MPRMDMNPVQRAEHSLLESRRALAEGRESDMDAQGFMLNAFEDSMNLFLSSIKYQDPMDPMDPTEMSKQMFQLSQAQGLHGMHTKLTELLELQKAGQVLSTAELIGKTVEVKSDRIELDGSPVEMSYQLPQGVAAAKLQITDKTGGVVYEHDFTPGAGEKELPAGLQSVNWDGFVNTPYGKGLNGGQSLQEGLYRVKITTFDKEGEKLIDPLSGSPVQIPTKVTARLKGSDFSENIPKIIVAGEYLPLSALVNIQEQGTRKIHSERLDELKEAMELLSPEDQKVIRQEVKKEAADSLKQAAKLEKLEERMNHLSAAQYRKILERAQAAQASE